MASPEDQEIPIRQLNIFLLEFVVDSIAIDEQVKLLIDDYYQGLLCISFKFLNFPPIEICEELLPQGFYSSAPVFKSGRSGIFSIRDVECSEIKEPITVNGQVNLKFADDDEPAEVHIGDMSVDITQEITGIMFEAKIDPGRVPISRTIRQTYPLAGSKNKLTGFVSLFLRMSCFRDMIVQKVALCTGPEVTAAVESMVAENAQIQEESKV